MFKKTVQRGRSEVRDADDCRIMHVKFVNGRESVSAQCLRFSDAGEAVSRQCLGGESSSVSPARPEPAETSSFPVAVR